MRIDADNLVPRAHVSFGQRQDTELWNNKGVQRQNWCGLVPQRHSIRIHFDFISKHHVLNQDTHAP